MQRFLTLFCWSILLPFMPLHAQETNIGLGIQIGLPANEFKEAAADLVGFGFGGSIFRNLGETPFNLGIDGGYMIYGKNTLDTRIKVDGNWENATFTRNNNLIHGHLALRIRPYFSEMPVVPYFDAMIGFRYLYTRNRLKIDGFDEVETDTELYDWAFSYGGAAGVFIKLSPEIALNLRLLYQIGSEAEYATADDIEVFQDGSAIYHVRKSKTDMFIPQVGISFFIE